MTPKEEAEEIIRAATSPKGTWEKPPWKPIAPSLCADLITKALESREQKGAHDEAERMRDWYREASQREFKAGKQKGREEVLEKLGKWEGAATKYSQYNAGLKRAAEIAEEYAKDTKIPDRKSFSQKELFAIGWLKAKEIAKAITDEIKK